MLPATSAALFCPFPVILPKPSVAILVLPNTVVSTSVTLFFLGPGTTLPVMSRAVPLPPASLATVAALP
ncbi:hypothetical protein P154DRAFT_527365 [Amniculicola lignicola CBS 123094]|uniref:Uncharacterized protein n=1 Tax=Amniculicola lignicola CBS 123094 TaxID=1392246 RepID=A0A6A5VYM2_9PLEO|nr:hypothetical protein P154DRAFT_527365 [Amniculicola lignicola CBS 123094]